MENKEFTLQEAIDKAKVRNEDYNFCEEYADAWYFCVDDGEETIGGPNTGCVILKSDGTILLPYQYFLGGNYNAVSTGITISI